MNSSLHTLLSESTNTHVPAQPRTEALRTLIPLSSCDKAAELIIEYFGEEDLKKFVGGRCWWQVRGLRGIQAEWIAMRKDWRRAEQVEKGHPSDPASKAKEQRTKRSTKHERRESLRPIVRRQSHRIQHAQRPKQRGRRKKSLDHTRPPKEQDIDQTEHANSETLEELDRLRRILYYIPGGGYYFGSIDTHRLMITRFARKFGGRAFAINYRKAPQYPWPCAVQDVLAGYLYLIDPPPEAKHKAIDPSQIVVAGDSAGGGLSLALLGILRDLGLPMPSGGVLLSPWCDMTHSFPSILQNTTTDIIPKYGFIHKPSTLWPVPDEANVEVDERDKASKRALEKESEDEKPNVVDVHDSVGHTDTAIPPPVKHLATNPIDVTVTKNDDRKETIRLTRQIQLYATNAQLYHPLCSSVLQGSLGGLPPLYILAGDAEVLRDEIIYLAHRAARPDQYPLKKDLLDANVRAQEAAKRFNHTPTKVHLQVYDGQPHVLTLFSFTTSARYAYRAIASFVKHVTGAPTSVINPFPDLNNVSTLKSDLSEAPSEPPLHQSMRRPAEWGGSGNLETEDSVKPPVALPHTSQDHRQRSHSAETKAVDAPVDAQAARVRKRRNVTLGTSNDYDGQVPLRRPTYVQEMIRERVDIRGKIRPLEPDNELQALQMPIEEIGVIKEGPVQRYLTGQALWDEKFKRQSKRVAKRRHRNEKYAKSMLEQAAQEGLLGRTFEEHEDADDYDEAGNWADLSRLGPLNLEGENPPPSAIAGRRDTVSRKKGADKFLTSRRFRRSPWNFCVNPYTCGPNDQVGVLSLLRRRLMAQSIRAYRNEAVSCREM